VQSSDCLWPVRSAELTQALPPPILDSRLGDELRIHSTLSSRASTRISEQLFRLNSRVGAVEFRRSRLKGSTRIVTKLDALKSGLLKRMFLFPAQCTVCQLPMNTVEVSSRTELSLWASCADCHTPHAPYLPAKPLGDTVNTDIKLSTRFHQAQGAHEVGVLVTLAGETPAKRPRINIALVLDRSGSMAGAPLDAAKEATRRFTSFLGTGDRVTLVAFDDEVRVLDGPGPVDQDRLGAAIDGIRPGGSTNLSGGWLTGRTHVQSDLGDGTNRVVLLTDGQANRGIVEPSQLTGITGGALEARVTTTCIGFGSAFNEDLLGAMARAGGGNYWYVENTDQMADIFSQEIEGLVALAAQNLTIEVRATHAAVHGVSFPQSFTITRSDDGAWHATLGDLYATAPRSFGIILHVADVGTLGETRLAEVHVTADVMVADGVEHRVITLPVVANISGSNAIEPVVEVTLLRYAAAAAREDAIRNADAGQFDKAAQILEDAAAPLAASGDQTLHDEAADLREQATRLRDRVYEARDRKYNMVRSRAAHEDKLAYLERTRRPSKDRRP
jgi:Mg-chelatase subunit ChlD